MSWEDIEEVTALELRGKKLDPETTYVILEKDIYPKSVKIKLSELKKWVIDEIGQHIEKVHKIANVGYQHCQKIGGFK